MNNLRDGLTQLRSKIQQSQNKKEWKKAIDDFEKEYNIPIYERIKTILKDKN